MLLAEAWETLGDKHMMFYIIWGSIFFGRANISIHSFYVPFLGTSSTTVDKTVEMSFSTILELIFRLRREMMNKNE